MRTLKFPPGSKAFQFAHEATLAAQMKLSTQQHRTVAKLQSKFEAVGSPISKEQNGPYMVYVCPKGAKVELEEAEFSLLKEMLENTAFMPFAAKIVAGLVDLLESTKEDEVKSVARRGR